MRFSAYEPRGRFRAIRARPYQFDITVVGGGFLIVMVGITFFSFMFPLLTHQFYRIPSADEMVRPVYPAEAREQGVEGEVVVRFRVNIDGEVLNPEIIEETVPGVFGEAVLDAVRQLSYREFRHLGRPTEMLISLRYHFRMPPAPADRNWHRRSFSAYPEQVVFGSFDTPPVLIHRNDPLLLGFPSQSGLEDVFIIEEIRDTWGTEWMKEGVVTFTVDETGQVRFPGIPWRFNKRMKVYGVLQSTILDSVREWRFQPATRNGEAVSILICQRVEYIHP
ncbi:TonB family protein [Gemmatimonadota bacterium]